VGVRSGSWSRTRGLRRRGRASLCRRSSAATTPAPTATSPAASPPPASPRACSDPRADLTLTATAGRVSYRPWRSQGEVRVALLHRREGAKECRFELAVDATAAVAGGPVEGELRGLEAPADVTLLRIEMCPAGKLATPM